MPELIPQAIDEIRTLCPDVLVVTGDLIDVPFYGMDDPTTTDQVCQDLTLLKRLIAPSSICSGTTITLIHFAEFFPMHNQTSRYRAIDSSHS